MRYSGRGSLGDLVPVTEEFLVLEALPGGSCAPATEAAWFERLPHVGDDLAFFQARYLTNFLEGDAVGPGGPDDPVGTALGWLGLFDSGDREIGLLGFHRLN